MLINAKGKEVHVHPSVRGHSLKGVPNHANISILAPLTEVLEPSTTHCGPLFRLGTRARMRS